MKKLINTAFVYTLLALVGGVFYREFTKFNGVPGGTSLAFLHLHLMVLGAFFFLILTLFERQFSLTKDRRFGWFFPVYNVGLGVTAAAFLWRGVLQTLGIQPSHGLDASISGVAGVGHILLAVGLLLLFGILKRAALRRESRAAR